MRYATTGRQPTGDEDASGALPESPREPGHPGLLHHRRRRSAPPQRPLKAALVAFGQSQRFAGEFRSVYADRFGTAKTGSQVDYINFLDRFVLEHRCGDGRTVVEQFVASRPDLPEAERAMLQRWVTVVEGIFEVEGHDGDAVVMVNLVDELTYRVRSNAGRQLLERLTPETILWARVVPFGEDWLLSGALNAVPIKARREMCRAAAEDAPDEEQPPAVPRMSISPDLEPAGRNGSRRTSLTAPIATACSATPATWTPMPIPCTPC